MEPISEKAAAEIPAMPPDVHFKVLENGLVIIVREDHSAPVVSAQAWCNAGSIHEGNWLGAGMSHVLEHMLFKGTTTRGAARIDQEVQNAGGYMNAYTSFDRTVYWINVPDTGARVAIDILCDIMQHATLPETELEKEKQVIRREMDMNRDDPSRRSSRRLFETAYTRSPYRYTIIGYPDIFNDLTQPDILGYYRSHYVPNNVFYVVVGHVSADSVIQQISEAYRETRAKSLPALVVPEEPKQTAAREVVEEDDIELGHLHFSWHIPDLRHADTPALDVLATLLGNGRSSRLFREVREKKGAVNSIDAWTYNPGNPGLFGVSAVVNGDQFGPARLAVFEEIERVKENLVSADELAKVIKQFSAATLATRKTMQGQAQDLGSNWLAANDLNFSERYLAAVKTITRAELRRIARHYLAPENRTLYALLPQGCAPRRTMVTEQRSESPIQKFELPNGLKLLVKEDHRLPFVEFRAVFRGGVLAENARNNGLTQLTAKMLLQGTQKRSAEQIATEIESVGGSIDVYGGNNSFGLNIEVMRDDFGAGLDLFADVIRRPIFPPELFERERQVQLAIIKGQRDHLLHSAGRLLRRALFGEQAYGLDASGSEEAVQRLTIPELQSFHRSFLCPNNCVLAIFGDIETDRVRNAVQRMLGDWTRLALPVSSGAGAEITEAKRTSDKREKKQAVFLIGFPGTTVQAADRFALELIQEACSDLGSRLFLRIREKLGLAYYVGAQNFLGLIPGYFAFYAGTARENLERVEAELWKEVETLRHEGLSAEELQRAKAKVIGQKKIARQDLGSLAMIVALDELYGLGFESYDREDVRFEAVTAADIQTAAQNYLRREWSVTAWIEPV